MSRVLAAARLQLIRPAVILGVPWAVAGSSFVINWGVWSLADESLVADTTASVRIVSPFSFPANDEAAYSAFFGDCRCCCCCCCCCCAGAGSELSIGIGDVAGTDPSNCCA